MVDATPLPRAAGLLTPPEGGGLASTGGLVASTGGLMARPPSEASNRLLSLIMTSLLATVVVFSGCRPRATLILDRSNL